MNIQTNEGEIVVTFLENEVEFVFPDSGFSLEFRIFNDTFAPTFVAIENILNLNYRGFDYKVEIADGIALKIEIGFIIKPRDNKLKIKLR